MENRRQLFAMLGAALAAGGAESAHAKVADNVFGAEKARKLEHPFGVQHIYYQGATDMLRIFEAGSLSLKSGMEPHAPHKHPEEEIMIVTAGSGDISVEGEITKVGPGSMMFTGANRLHGVKNTGKAPLLFYYFKWLKA
jgi:mannose-6-phosphate isomerase-like protein (cupin superfamily)